MQYLDESQKWQNDLCFQGKPFNITVIQVYAPTSNAEEAEVEQFYEDRQELLELTPKKDVLFIIGDWNAKVRVTLGSLYIEAQGCVPVLLENLCGMSCSGTCWPLGGAWFQCRDGGFWWAPVN